MITSLQRSGGSVETLLSDRFYRGTEERSLRRARISPTTVEAERRLTIPFGDGAFVFEPAPEDWIVPILESVCELGALPQNWNSYGAQPIRREIAATAVTVLLKLLTPRDPVPSVVPTSRGGILLEWHEGGIDLEVDIRSPSRCHVSIEDGQHEEEYDSTDSEAVEEKLDVLRSRLS